MYRGNHCAVQVRVETNKPALSSTAAAPGPAPASLRDSATIATAAAAHRHAPSEAYELEDLDEDWVAMLNVLDNRLLEVKQHELNCIVIVKMPILLRVVPLQKAKHATAWEFS